MNVSQDELFHRLRAAYLRGAKWTNENVLYTPSDVEKAANDYADAVVPPLTPTVEKVETPAQGPSPETHVNLPADVVELVCAAREFWDANNDASAESTALDKALEAFASRVRYANEPDDIAEASLDNHLPMDARVAFGLEAQGHIPAVEAALAEGADWQDIGRRIGWDGETAKTYYERHLARLATTEGQTDA